MLARSSLSAVDVASTVELLWREETVRQVSGAMKHRADHGLILVKRGPRA